MTGTATGTRARRAHRTAEALVAAQAATGTRARRALYATGRRPR